MSIELIFKYCPVKIDHPKIKEGVDTRFPWMAVGASCLIAGSGRTEDAARNQAIENYCPHAMIVHSSLIKWEYYLNDVVRDKKDYK